MKTNSDVLLFPYINTHIQEKAEAIEIDKQMHKSGKHKYDRCRDGKNIWQADLQRNRWIAHSNKQ